MPRVDLDRDPMKKFFGWFALCLVTYLLLSVLWILIHGEQSHRGNISYLRWKHGLGPYKPNVVTPLIGHDRGIEETVLGKSEAWFRDRFPELDPPSFEDERYARKQYGTTSSQVFQIRGSDMFVVIDGGKVVAMKTIKGT